MTSTQLASAVGLSQGKVSKIETGAQSVRMDHVDAWLRACGASEHTRSELFDVAEAALTEAATWRQEHRAGMIAKQARTADMEQRTTRLRTFEPAVVPGLVQTPAYAAAILRQSDITGQRDIAAAAAARMDRQRVLDADIPQVEVLMLSGALNWRPSEQDGLIAEQAERIAHLAESSRANIGVVPTSAVGIPPPLAGFGIYDLADDSELVVVETFAAEIYHDDPRDVAVYVEVFDKLTAAARFGSDVRKALTEATR